MKYDIGAARRAEAEKNKRAIEAYFVKNPFDRQYECAEALGLSVMAVSRHRRALLAERKAERA